MSVGTESTPQSPGWVQEAFEKGYKEALLDVYCFLTGNEQILDYPERFTVLESLAKQVNDMSSMLVDVTDELNLD